MFESLGVCQNLNSGAGNHVMARVTAVFIVLVIRFRSMYHCVWSHIWTWRIAPCRRRRDELQHWPFVGIAKWIY